MKWFSSFLLLILGISLSSVFKGGNNTHCAYHGMEEYSSYDAVNKVFRMQTYILGTIPLAFQMDSCQINKDGSINLLGYIGKPPDRRFSKKDTCLIQADSNIDLQGLWSGKYDKLRRDTSRHEAVYIIRGIRKSFTLMVPVDTVAISDEHGYFKIKKLVRNKDKYLIFYAPKDGLDEYSTVCTEGFF